MATFWDEYKEIIGKETDLSNFKSWKSVLHLPLYGYYDNNNHYVEENFEFLVARADIEQWLKVLKEPEIGHNSESYERTNFSFLNSPCSSWTMKTINHLLQFEAVTGKSIHDYKQIVDFGAGIGETTRVIHDLGYKGKLYICDLPEVARISSYYLNELGIKFRSVSDIRKIPNKKKTLFIATWSLSEVPIDDRARIVERFAGHDFLIISQKRHAYYDNVSYFQNEFPLHSKTNCIYRDSSQDFTVPDDMSFFVFGIGEKT